jgi:uncharacterized cupredoxin-like copper-binding protein
MNGFRKWVGLLAAGVALVAAACSSSATSTASSPSTSAAQSQNVAIVLDQWSINASATTIPSGKVTFTVKNEGTIAHEFVVLRTDTAAADFPIASFEGEPNRFDEDAAGTNVGETGDMEAGTTKSLVIPLPAGHYALFCNLPAHYGLGMHADFSVS